MEWLNHEDRGHAVAFQVKHSAGEVVNCWAFKDHREGMTGLQWRCRWIPKVGESVELSMQPDRLDHERQPAEATMRMASAWIREIKHLRGTP